MSYFARVKLDEWKLEDAIQHHGEKNPDGDKLLLQLVWDDLNNLVDAEHKEGERSSRKILSTIENILEAQASEITGGNFSIGNIWIPLHYPHGRGTSMREHHVCRRFSERDTRATSYFVDIENSK